MWLPHTNKYRKKYHTENIQKAFSLKSFKFMVQMGYSELQCCSVPCTVVQWGTVLVSALYSAMQWGTVPVGALYSGVQWDIVEASRTVQWCTVLVSALYSGLQWVLWKTVGLYSGIQCWLEEMFSGVKGVQWKSVKGTMRYSQCSVNVSPSQSIFRNIIGFWIQ